MPSSTKPDDSDALYSEIPLFAPAGHEIPRLAADQTAEDLPPALGALSHLLYDEESPEEKAEALREKGNELLKRGGIKERGVGRMYLKKAVQVYTEAIAVECPIPEVAAAGYANRAEAHLRLKNYGYVLKDCEEALKLDKNHVKSLYRGAKAALAIGKYDIARRYCGRGVELGKEGGVGKKQVAAFEGILKMVALQAKKGMDKQVERAERLKMFVEKENKLRNVLKERNVRLGLPLFSQQRNYANVEVQVDDEGTLIWPLLVVYPEGVNEGGASQSDYIEEVHEDTLLGDVVEMLWPEGQPGPRWDVGRVYSRGRSSLKILYRKKWTWEGDELDEEERESAVGSEKGLSELGEWVSVGMDVPLRQLLSNPDYITPLFPVMYLVPRQFVPP